MSAEDKRSEDGQYWRGVTDAQVQAIQTALSDIRTELRTVNQRIQDLSDWRHEVIGQAMTRSAVVSVTLSVVVSAASALVSWVLKR